MTFRSKARRAGWLLVVAAFAFGLFSAIRPSQANAYGLITTRFIKMSSSIGDANNVMYNIGFTTASAINLTTIAIHFCSNDPIIGDTCGVPANFSTNVSSIGFNSWTATNGVTQPTINTTTTATPNVILLTRSASVVPSGTVFNFELGNGTTNGFHNPQLPNVTFFARITLYASGTTVDFSTDTAAKTTENAATDAGGVAMSTANALAVTAKVQEQLTFCVYTDPTSCSGGGNTIALGDSNGVLSSTSTYYTNPALTTPKIDLASNALGGVIVRLKGDTLTSGAFSITAQGEGLSPGFACVADSTATSSEQFGIRIVTYGTGQAAPTPGGEDDFGCLAGNHKFVPTNTNTTYGEPFIKTAGATDLSTSTLELGAKASSTTEAGVYKSTLQFIATATY